jgi:putative tryptophan/tyrosine transport system substrate-binding protein
MKSRDRKIRSKYTIISEMVYRASLNALFAEVMPQQAMKLFRGAKIADIPIEQSTKFKLVINLKTANAIGVTVSPALLLRADKLIE